MRTLSVILLASLLPAVAPDANGFALLGPFKNRANDAPDPWQGKPYGGLPGGLGYELQGDIGGPMFLYEAYRWNIPVIYYGFDQAFVDYFGQPGIDAVEQAVAILNALPPVSELSEDLMEYPFNTKGENAYAAGRSLLDLKSHTLPALLEQLGLANPERFVWGLRWSDYNPDFPEESVVMLNFDPVTHAPSRYVNGLVYNFQIFDRIGPQDREWASAIEWFQLDPRFAPYSSVAGSLGSSDFQLGSGPDLFWTGLASGQFIEGLTRDDVGGLRFLLRRGNKVREPLLPGVTGAGMDSSNYVNLAVRGGVEKLTFVRLELDTATGRFVSATNAFLDMYYTNAVAVTQTLQRTVTHPDILFSARDLGVEFYQDTFGSYYYPGKILERSDTSRWQNNNALNQQPGAGGPGIIHPGATITFSTMGRYAFAKDRAYLRFAPYLLQWASFNGSTNAPVTHFGPLPAASQFHLGTRVTLIDGVKSVQTTIHAEFGRTYRIDYSTNLVHWTPWYWRDNADGIFTIDHPIEGLQRFFRVTKEPWPW